MDTIDIYRTARHKPPLLIFNMRFLDSHLLSLMLSLTIAFSTTACGGGEGNTILPQPPEEKPAADRQTVSELSGILWHKTSCLDLNQTRLDALTEMQKYADQCQNTSFKSYYALTDKTACGRLEENSILGFHARALDKIMEEVKGEKVENGHVALWLLYNMGYIVKTPSHCFGIDIKHKNAAEMAPLIEFLCITHAHEDHYTQALIDEMARLGKPVYSNFIDNKWKIPGKATVRPSGDVTIRTLLVDHNSELPDFVTTYEIDCGADTGNKTIYHSGDAYSHKQLSTSVSPDIFIPHLAVGLDMNAAIGKLQPGIVLLSHLLEMDHPIEKWRWSYEYGINLMKGLDHDKVYIPVWGEKIIL